MMQQSSHNVYVEELICVIERIRFCDNIGNFDSATTKMKLWWYAQKILKAWAEDRDIPILPDEILQMWEQRYLQAMNNWREHK